MLKSSKANTLANKLTDRTSSMLGELASNIMHEEKKVFKYTVLVYVLTILSLDPKWCLMHYDSLSLIPAFPSNNKRVVWCEFCYAQLGYL